MWFAQSQRWYEQQRECHYSLVKARCNQRVDFFSVVVVLELFAIGFKKV